MDVFVVCFNSVLPIFLLIAIGYLSRILKLIDSVDIPKFNRIVFNVFLPVMLFNNIYTSDLSTAVRPRLIAFGVISVLLIFGLCIGAVLLTVKDKSKQGVMIQGLYRSNFVIVGLPVAQALLGSTDLSPIAVQMAIITPLFNVLAVICLAAFSGQRVNIKATLLQVLKNPLIIGSVAGIAFLLLDITLPASIESVLTDMSRVASPIMLFLLGAFFRFNSLSMHKSDLLYVCIGRLVIIPAIFLAISYWSGFRNVEFVALMTIFASSTAVSSFTMAQQMGANAELAGDIVVSTSVACSFTLYIWSVVFKSLGAF